MASPEKKAFALRLDRRVWDAIERLAAVELRSANAQIEILIREALMHRAGKAGGMQATVMEAPAAVAEPSLAAKTEPDKKQGKDLP